MTFVCFALLTLVTEKGVLKLSPIIVDFFPHIISPNFCFTYFGIILLGTNTFVFIQLPINRPFYNYEKTIPALSLALLPAFLSAFSNSNISQQLLMHFALYIFPLFYFQTLYFPYI